MKIRLLLIEDNHLLRNGLIEILKPQKDIMIIPVEADEKKSILELQQLKPDVILLDLGLRSLSSLQIVEIVKRDFPKAGIIVMDLAPVHADILMYVEAGASGFVLKDASLDDLLITIRSVAEGSSVLPALKIDSLFSQIVGHALIEGQSGLRDAVKMTKREREVIDMLSEGMSNKEIGHKIHISANAVKSHIHNIMEKLALHKHLEVAGYFYNLETLRAIAAGLSIVSK